MTEKRFYLNEGTVGTLKILDIKADNEKIYLTASKSDMEIVVELLNTFAEENEQLKQKIEYQQEVIVDAIDSLMELPSVTLYLSKQWLEACEDYDSMEDMKNTFSEKIKELEK